MDKAQAKLFAQQLIEEGPLDGWSLTRMLGHGKSAVVMRGERDGSSPAAVKVFHPELIERFGLDSQMERISREKALIGNDHPSAVQIIAGGLSEPHSRPYIVMSLEEGDILSDCLDKISESKIRHIIAQLAGVAKHLEELGFAHRDIKPDNIMVTDLEVCTIKVLDFGVLRPLGASSITDGPEYTPFVGTHQYSPPEMLHRQEEFTPEAWRAITFYQIGAVLHDLLVKRPLFEEYKEPYANLVVAVDSECPVFGDIIQDRELVGLAKRCLLKKPEDRLRLLRWDDFLRVKAESAGGMEERLERLARLQQTKLAEQVRDPLEQAEAARLTRQRSAELVKALRANVEVVLDQFGEKLPPRILDVKEQSYPLPSVRCDFVKDKTLAFGKAFYFELAVQQTEESAAVQVYLRSAVEGAPEADWINLGGFTEELFGLRDSIGNWLFDLMEQLLAA